MTSLTAYEPVVSSLQDLSEGQLVRVDDDALEEAGLDEAEFNEPIDDEYDYEKLGFITDVHEDDFSWVGPDGDESVTVEVNDETVYIVAMAPSTAGAHPFYAEDLEPVDRDKILGDLDVDADPTEAEAGTVEAPEFDETAELVSVSDAPGISRNDMGLSPWPESWRESSRPARLIAMDAWTSMGSTFRGCRRSLVGSVRNPNRICAAFKDSILGHEMWRSGG